MPQAKKKHPEYITISHARKNIIMYSRQQYRRLIDMGFIEGGRPEGKGNTSEILINTASLYRYLDTLK